MGLPGIGQVYVLFVVPAKPYIHRCGIQCQAPRLKGPKLDDIRLQGFYTNQSRMGLMT
jgi:hypothetical protein